MHWLIRLLALSIVAVGNWLALAAMAFLVLVGWRGATGDTNPDLPLWLPIGAAVVVMGLGILSGSPWGEWFFRLFYPIRPPTRREAAKLTPAMERVRAAYQAGHRRPLPVKLFLIDDPMPQAMALGLGTIAVTRGALEVATDDEVAGVLAHEAGHLHHRDSLVTSALIGMNSISLVQAVLAEVAKIFFWIGLVVGAVLLIVSMDFAWVAGLTILTPIVLMVGNVISRVITGFVANLLGLADRSVEYRADRFAQTLGFGPGLVGFLDRLAGMEANSEHRFLVMYLQSHPPTALRIDRLEQLQEIKAAA